MLGRILHKPLAWVVAGLLAAGASFGLYWFQPWKLISDRQVDEVLSSPAPVMPSTTSDGTTATSSPPAGPRLLAQGMFVTHEHATSGTARIVQDATGARRLELVGLDTSNGPDLRVWLTDQPVLEGRAGWFVFDDGRYHELGRLKGNQGNQAYEIPPDLDLGQFRSVSIWCKRFAVSFGAATLGTV